MFDCKFTLRTVEKQNSGLKENIFLYVNDKLSIYCLETKLRFKRVSLYVYVELSILPRNKNSRKFQA